LQLGDISQYGNAKDVAGLLTPPGVKLLSTRKDVLEQPERDTGTVRGKVKASPQTLYRYPVPVIFLGDLFHLLKTIPPPFSPFHTHTGAVCMFASSRRS